MSIPAPEGTRSKSRSAKATLTGLSHFGVIELFRCMRLGDATFSMPDWTLAELAKAALEARR
jgi:hypothetical protein